MNKKSKKKQTPPSFAYVDAEDRTVTLKFNNNNWGNIHLLLAGAQEHLGMEDLDTVKKFVDEAIAFYFNTLNQAIGKNIAVKQQAAAAEAAKNDKSGTEDTAGTDEQPSEVADTGALADEDQGDSKTTGTEG